MEKVEIKSDGRKERGKFISFSDRYGDTIAIMQEEINERCIGDYYWSYFGENYGEYEFKTFAECYKSFRQHLKEHFIIVKEFN